jgi:hypothetical protein
MLFINFEYLKKRATSTTSTVLCLNFHVNQQQQAY